MSYDPGAVLRTDPRFGGIAYTNLATAYRAPLDGTSRLMSAAAALALYPQCGAAPGSTIEWDTAAWLQAESDMRNGAGGVIYLPDGAQMRVSNQLYLQNAAKVWFHGGRGCKLFTAGTGSTPAVRVSHGDQRLESAPLRDINLLAQPALVDVSTETGGVAHTGYASGSIALTIDSTQGATYERVTWNGYDLGTQFGDDVFTNTFRDCAGTGCNIAVDWREAAGENSMERMRFENGNYSNNNIAFNWNATFGSNSQGGSVFITGCSIDYNIVRAINYIGMASGQTSCGNSFHVWGNHIETTGACSGTTLARAYAAGTITVAKNELYEADGGHPPGWLELADNGMATVDENRMNANAVPFVYSSTTARKRVYGTGNFCQDVQVRPILLSDGNGQKMQRNAALELIDLSGDAGFLLEHQDCLIYCNQGTLTFQPDSSINHFIGATATIGAANTSGTQLLGASGVAVVGFNGLGTTVAAGLTATVAKVAPNVWAVFH